MSSLSKYNQKRNFNKTKEPMGKRSKKAKKLRFCIQHHIARKDHYDLRLEWNGVLISWAIPKGPSYNDKDKRLAIMVEDHPIDYRNFEGTIPKGEYGGGTVMLWDKGYWEPIKGYKPNFKEGPIKFILKGSRLKGIWTLVKLKDDNNWLLIKDEDEYHLYDNINEFNTSIKTGRTMDEIATNIKKNEITFNKAYLSKTSKEGLLCVTLHEMGHVYGNNLILMFLTQIKDGDFENLLVFDEIELLIKNKNEYITPREDIEAYNSQYSEEFAENKAKERYEFYRELIGSDYIGEYPL